VYSSWRSIDRRFDSGVLVTTSDELLAAAKGKIGINMFDGSVLICMPIALARSHYQLTDFGEVQP
jgi:hypothetical protein